MSKYFYLLQMSTVSGILADYHTNVEALGKLHQALTADYTARSTGQPAYSEDDMKHLMTVLQTHSTTLNHISTKLHNMKLHTNAKILSERGQHTPALHQALKDMYPDEGFAQYLAGAGWMAEMITDAPEVKARLQKYHQVYTEMEKPKGLEALASGYGNEEIIQRAKHIDDINTMIEGVARKVVSNVTINDLIDELDGTYRGQLSTFLAGAGVKGWNNTVQLNKLRMAFDDVDWEEEEAIPGLTAFVDGLSSYESSAKV